MRHPLTAPAFMTARQLAARWQTTTHAIHQRRWRGDAPPALKLGARLLFRTADIERFEAARENSNTAQNGAALMKTECQR